MEKKSVILTNLGLSILLVWMLYPATSLAIENSECIDCHGDETLYRTKAQEASASDMHLYIDEEKFNHSAHQINGVSCVDCHSDIQELNYDDEVPHKGDLDDVACTSCHDQAGDAFKNSVHMNTRRKGIIMRCYACHDYHYVTHQEASSVAERGNNMCLKCHNPYQGHDWLPQKNAHFDFVECTACHAPDVSHHFHLTFYDLVTRKYLSGNEILKVLQVDDDEFMPLVDKNKDRSINIDEFDNLVLMLRQKTVHTTVHAELVAELQPLVHNITKEKAERNCEKCHSATSSFFDAVTIVLSKDDGTVNHHKVDRAALESYHTRHFYALAGTRMRLLDKIGIGLLAGGVFVVLGHLFVRVATIPVRRRKEDENQTH